MGEVYVAEEVREEYVSEREEFGRGIDKWGRYIDVEIPGEPSRGDEGAATCAIRLLRSYRAAPAEICRELGVPDESYPAPVANAHLIATLALQSEWNESTND